MSEIQKEADDTFPMDESFKDELQKLGFRFGPASPEEIARWEAERAERDFQIMKRRLEAKERRESELSRELREAFQRKREEQV